MTVLSTRDAIVANILANVPDSGDRLWVLVELAALTEDSDPSEAAGVFDAAVEIATTWGDGERSNPEIEDLFDAFLNDDTLFH